MTHPPAPAWFCLRTQPKHEHIAAAHLQQDPDIEVYLPRIRFKRATRRGPVWFTEALFPNYLFARFDLAACLRRVCHARGVRGVVHFGDRWPIVPEAVIEELRATVGADQVHVVRDEVRPGRRGGDCRRRVSRPPGGGHPRHAQPGTGGRPARVPGPPNHR